MKYLGDTHELLDEALVLDVPEVNPLVGNVQQGKLVRLAEKKGLIRNIGSQCNVNTYMQIIKTNVTKAGSGSARNRNFWSVLDP